MKNCLTTFRLTAFLLTLICISANAQTNFGGGIYTNTTWTKANSPYIIIDTVVVFPNVTLTIEPGVKVMFEAYKRLEIRNGSIVAIGTSADPIIFTYVSTATPGIWGGIYLNHSNTNVVFNHCQFSSADRAIYTLYPGNLPTLQVSNSVFTYNNTGINVFDFTNKKQFSIDSCYFVHNGNYGLDIGGGSFALITNSRFSQNGTGVNLPGYASIRNCIVDSNYAGIYFSSTNDSIINCSVKNNVFGIIDTNGGFSGYITKNVISNNQVGLKLLAPSNKIFCNSICYNFKYNVMDFYSTNNINLSGNSWCTSDSSEIRHRIFDGYVNIDYGLVNYMPLDSEQCSPADTQIFTGATMYYINNTLPVFPNPASNYITVTIPGPQPENTVRMYNLLGEEELYSVNHEAKVNLDISGLSSGVHIIEVATGQNIFRQKVIKQ